MCTLYHEITFMITNICSHEEYGVYTFFYHMSKTENSSIIVSQAQTVCHFRNTLFISQINELQVITDNALQL